MLADLRRSSTHKRAMDPRDYDESTDLEDDAGKLKVLFLLTSFCFFTIYLCTPLILSNIVPSLGADFDNFILILPMSVLHEYVLCSPIDIVWTPFSFDCCLMGTKECFM